MSQKKFSHSANRARLIVFILCLQSMAPKAIVAATYGFTEIGTIVFYSGNSPAGSCGKPIANFEFKVGIVPNQTSGLQIKTNLLRKA